MRVIDQYRGFVFDLDGTVYLGDQLLPGAKETIDAIRSVDASAIFVTNNPLNPTTDYARKLEMLGIPAQPDEVLSSLDVLVHHLSSRYAGASIYCVSEPLVSDTLAAAGFEILDHQTSERADVVAVSFDRTFDYVKLNAAFRAVRAGASIVATNPDRFCPTPDGGLPDCASMLAAIEACSGARATAIVGKPSAGMMAAIVSRLGIPATELIVVGDRLETDVMMALEAGADAALVLSGATTRDEAAAAVPPPTYVLEGISGLLDSYSNTYETR